MIHDEFFSRETALARGVQGFQGEKKRQKGR
jgi:hypothetical protein